MKLLGLIVLFALAAANFMQGDYVTAAVLATFIGVSLR